MKQPPNEDFDLPRQIQGNQELQDLITRNNSLLIRFICADNVHQPDLEALAQMKMNRMKVADIGRHQDKMVDYLLTRGVERINGNGNGNGHHAPAAVPATEPLSLVAAADAPEKKSPGGARARTLIDYAREHGGELRLSDFRAEYAATDQKFAATGVYPVAHTLLKAGVIERVNEGLYRLVEDGPRKKRGRPRKEADTTEQGEEKPEEGNVYGNGKAAMLDWAKAHDGHIVLKEFIGGYIAAGGPKKFNKNMYMAAQNFQKAGVFERIDAGHYKLVEQAAAAAAPATVEEEPAAAPDPEPTPEPDAVEAPAPEAQAAPVTDNLEPWPGSGGREAILYWAAHHDGHFHARDFRAWWLQFNPESTFVKTTMFTTLRHLQEGGFAKKLGAGEYRIYVSKARKALGLE